MYKISIEQSFAAAHFLAGYEGPCSSLHGHNWRVVACVASDELIPEGSARGMVMDFLDIHNDLAELTSVYDHALVYETGTLKDATISAFHDEGFRLVEVPFRTTSENFARYFYDRLVEKGYHIDSVEVWETPDCSAIYTEN